MTDQDCKTAKAFEVHVALIRVERDAPWLRTNHPWSYHKAEAYADFVLLYEGKMRG